MTVQPPPPTLQTGSTSGSSGKFVSRIERLTEAQAVAQGYTVIKTAEDFDKIRENLDGKYMLMGHIDLSGFDNWDPIGDDTAKFTGTLDGNGYSVCNLKIDRGSENWVGLFGFCDGAEFKNIGVQGADVIGNKFVGILAGRTVYTKIDNCFSTGKISSNEGRCGGLIGITDYTDISNSHTDINLYTNSTNAIANGGIVGRFQNKSTIDNCFSSGEINSNASNNGGIIGTSYSSGNERLSIKNSYSNCNITTTGLESGGIIGRAYSIDIQNCSYTGAITSTKNANGGICGATFKDTKISQCHSSGTIICQYGSGGILGVNAPSATNITIENCYSSMDIHSTWQVGDDYTPQVGGIIGLSQGTINISNCYSTGDIYSKYSKFVGGGFGAIDYETQVYNCFSTGKVICEDTTTYSDYYGGLYGIIANSACIYNSYWNKDTSGMDTNGNIHSSHVGTIENVEGLSSAQMDQDFIKNTLGWDESIWDFSGSLPKLKNLPQFGAYFTPEELRRFQVGAMGDKDSMLLIDTTLSLDISGIDLMTADSSASSIEKIDELINVVTQKRASFGIAMSRLEAITSSHTVTIENLTAAKSTIMDADMAKETTDYVRNNILTQTSSTLLSQAGRMNNNAILMLVRGM